MMLVAQVWYLGRDPENVRGKKRKNQSFQEPGVAKGDRKERDNNVTLFFSVSSVMEIRLS